MIGRYKVCIKAQRVIYNFYLNNKVTIIRGDSASGKTTLYDLIVDYRSDKESSGIDISITPNCNIIPFSSLLWEEGARPENSIIIIDEHFKYLSNHDFNTFLNTSNNYFIISDRDDTGNLDFGIEDMYELHTSGKYTTFNKMYTNYLKLIKNDDINYRKVHINDIDKIITEDSALGCKFYYKLYDKETISSYGNSKVLNTVLDNINSKLFIVVDGSAFGKCIQPLDALIRRRDNLHLFIPDSFECVLLKSDVIGITKEQDAKYYEGIDVNDILKSPKDYIDITKFTLEQYYEDILVKCMAHTKFPYSKSSENDFYVSAKLLSNARKIIPIDLTKDDFNIDVNKMKIEFE